MRSLRSVCKRWSKPLRNSSPRSINDLSSLPTVPTHTHTHAEKPRLGAGASQITACAKRGDSLRLEIRRRCRNRSSERAAASRDGRQMRPPPQDRGALRTPHDPERYLVPGHGPDRGYDVSPAPAHAGRAPAVECQSATQKQSAERQLCSAQPQPRIREGCGQAVIRGMALCYKVHRRPPKSTGTFPPTGGNENAHKCLAADLRRSHFASLPFFWLRREVSRRDCRAH